MKRFQAILCAFILFSVNAIAQNNYDKEIAMGYKGGIIRNLQKPDKSLNFCVIGGWGIFPKSS